MPYKGRPSHEVFRLTPEGRAYKNAEDLHAYLHKEIAANPIPMNGRTALKHTPQPGLPT